jgi:hypothetical protein
MESQCARGNAGEPPDLSEWVQRAVSVSVASSDRGESLGGSDSRLDFFGRHLGRRGGLGPFQDCALNPAAYLKAIGGRRPSVNMSGSVPWSGTTQPPQMNDPNELLNRIRRIDQTTAQTFHWVRIGVVVLILLAIVIVIIG